MENTLETARDLYDRGYYDKAFEMTTSISASDAEAGIVNPFVYLLMAKSVLNTKLLDDPFNKWGTNIFSESSKLAISAAEKIEDVWTIEKELRDAIAIWSVPSYQKLLAEFEKEPSREQINRVIQGSMRPFVLYGDMSIAARLCPLANKYKEENNLDKDHAYSYFLEDRIGSIPSFISNEQCAVMRIESAQRMYADAVAAYKDIEHASTEYVRMNVDAILDRFTYASLLANLVAMMSDIPIELSYKGYLLDAEILNYKLNAVIYPNGKARSLCSANRGAAIQELRKIYEKLTELDPHFQVPALPSEEPIKTESNEGCYIATAVYGSYDCPQVWTLRRFRDYTLAATWYGRVFIRTYYAISPTLVKWFGHTDWFKKLWKYRLDCMVSSLNANGVENSPYEDRIW